MPNLSLPTSASHFYISLWEYEDPTDSPIIAETLITTKNPEAVEISYLAKKVSEHIKRRANIIDLRNQLIQVRALASNTAGRIYISYEANGSKYTLAARGYIDPNLLDDALDLAQRHYREEAATGASRLKEISSPKALQERILPEIQQALPPEDQKPSKPFAFPKLPTWLRKVVVGHTS
ncbi:hypothetical protein ACIPL1_25205 [Pseudomonas sp. NPDC090202]|uniref:hypothetical protein n=1 Tax=unclassified Pseudomonas TaxID=196821 RepID=UPI0037F869CE